jgi:hypothetical protein
MAKDGLAVILGGAPKGKPGAKEEPSGEVDAAQDVLDAVKAGDAEMLSMAMKHFYELCSGGGDDEEVEDDELY